MKSLSISSATFAVAMSLATSAQANTGAMAVPSETIKSEPVIGFENVLEMPGTDLTVSSQAPMQSPEVKGELSVPLGVIDQGTFAPGAIGAQSSGGFVAVPAPTADLTIGPVLADGVVTARSLSGFHLDARYGDIDAFYGDIVAFYGDIDAFWDDISPFYGDIDAFYGDIDAFWGDISPFYGDITAFWGDIDAFWGDIVAFDAVNLASIGNFWQTNGELISAANASWDNGQLSSVNYRLNVLNGNAIGRFGANGFTQERANEVYARHGISLNDLSTLSLTTAQRAAFFLDWHDTVNTFSGIDAVDHWMGTINWTPALTQIQGDGADTLIAVIDSNFNSGDLSDNIVRRYYFADGANTDLNGHGSGVVSLIAAAHDGQGVMGIAPNANIFAFNPFDADGQTTWSRVSTALRFAGEYNRFNTLLGRDQAVSVVNLSLGESGWVASQGLADVLADPTITTNTDNTVFVIAAGNDGITQTADINWGYVNGALGRESDSTAIFVGSVRPNGTISNFSNRPGTSCLLDNGVCRSGNELMNRFIVAPGELLLVSDGNGGVVRRSGTSFAAPLVSGAIALLHDRWPWLQDHADETADIILTSARDLGAPGVDAVYGHGLLDVAASQSPLDFGSMSFTLFQRKGKSFRSYEQTAGQLLAEGGIPSWWETDDVYLTGIEDIGDTHRDFAIPASSFQYGKSTNALGNGYQRMQDFVADRFANWLVSSGADRDGDGTAGISQIRSGAVETGGQWKIAVEAIQPRVSQQGQFVPVHNAATLTDPSGKFAMTFGHGQGAMALSGEGFGVVSDYDPYSGGVNPILGLASGELFGQASYKIASTTTVSVGFSANREDWSELNTDDALEVASRQRLGAREASALSLSLEQKVADGFTVNAQWTRLDEQDAMFGAQATLLDNGTATDAVTVSASIDFGDGFAFDLSATGAASETNDAQFLSNRGTVWTTAGQVALSKQGLVGDRDRLRVSVGQPLNVEDGELEFGSLQVVDRATGELGRVDQTIGIETKRRIAGEIVYATPVTEGSEFGLFGRYVSAGGQDQEEALMIGANFGLRF